MKIVSLFSGIGGFEMGIRASLGEEAEFVFASELNPTIQKAHQVLHGILPHGDITKIDEKDIPDHDFLVAGFPCQSFSHAGSRRGFEDSRGTLFFDVARILKEKKPKYILLENVKGLTTHDKGKTFEVIKNTLEEIGYTIHYQILDSKFFGVPQTRQRIFIVGKYNDPTFTYAFPEEKEVTAKIKDILLDPPDSYGLTIAPSVRKRMVEGNKRIRILNDLDGIAYTVTTRQVSRLPNSGFIPYKDDYRHFGTLECFRLQGIPDSAYHELVRNGFSNHYMNIMVGNAVSPPVIHAIFDNLKGEIHGKKEA